MRSELVLGQRHNASAARSAHPLFAVERSCGIVMHQEKSTNAVDAARKDRSAHFFGTCRQCLAVRPCIGNRRLAPAGARAPQLVMNRYRLDAAGNAHDVPIEASMSTCRSLHYRRRQQVTCA